MRMKIKTRSVSASQKYNLARRRRRSCGTKAKLIRYPLYIAANVII